MFYKPHKLYKITVLATEKDENGDPLPNDESEIKTQVCDCFLHNIDTKTAEGYAGTGIFVTHYINMDKITDLNIGDEVEISDNGTVIGKGQVKDIKHTYGMQFASVGNKTTIFI